MVGPRSDLIEGFVGLTESPPEITGPVNLGNPVEFTVKKLAETVLEMVDSPLELKFHPLPHDDPRQRKPDIGYARETLGWEPKIQLRERLQPTIAYFKSLVDAGFV